MSTYQVLKLGGTSQCLEGYDNIIRIISNSSENEKFVIVLSAIKNVTNLLLKYCDTKNEQYIKQVIDLNMGLAQKCNVNIDNEIMILNSLSKIPSHDCMIQLISFGEYLSCCILNKYLNSQKIYLKNIELVDSLDIIKSNMNNNDGYYNKGEFEVNKEILIENLKDNKALIIPGFSGSTPDSKICLLGRGGSDTSGSIIATSLKAESYQIWTDVDGLYNCDPRVISEAQVIDRIGYQMAQEMAAMGAKVLHPYSILPCAKENIPIIIKNTFHPDNNSTIINGCSPINQIYAITQQKNVSIFKITSLNMWNNYGFVHDIFSHFKKYNVDINLINTSQFNITTTTDDTDLEKLIKIKDELSKNYKVELITNGEIISIIGTHIRTSDLISSIFKITKYVNILMTSYSSNDMTLSFVVKIEDSIKLIKKLYMLIFYNHYYEKKNSWYDEIILNLKENDLVNEQAIYVYNNDIIQQKIDALKQISSVDRFYYAMKANFNINILKQIIDSDLGIECVNIKEIHYLQKHLDYLDFPILFTPNFCSIKDYIIIFEMNNSNINVVVDNVNVLLEHPEIFQNKEIGIRLDLNCGKGHCDKVITQGKESKFGMNIHDLLPMLDFLKHHQIKIIGLHSHMGSGIHYYKNWSNILVKMIKYIDYFNDLKWIDIGGGLGIDRKINFDNLNTDIKLIKPENIKIIMEPGRFIVAESGILVGYVTQIKEKQNIKFIGTNIGMTDLIRPALYNAIHPIYFHFKDEREIKKQVVNVVGPICESCDVLIKNLLVDYDIQENDLVVVNNVGAYGYSMSSNYNLKQKPLEICFSLKQDKNYLFKN